MSRTSLAHIGEHELQALSAQFPERSAAEREALAASVASSGQLAGIPRREDVLPNGRTLPRSLLTVSRNERLTVPS